MLRNIFRASLITRRNITFLESFNEVFNEVFLAHMSNIKKENQEKGTKTKGEETKLGL